MKTRNDRGSGLALVLLVSSVLVIMVATVGNNTIQHLQNTNADMFIRQARYAAQAGLQAALVHLADDPNWTPDPNPLQSYLPDNPLVSAEVHVYNNFAGAMGTPGTADDGTEVPKGATYVLCLGRAGGHTSNGQAVMLSMAWYGESPLTMAAFAHERLTLQSSYTDAWPSTNPAGTVRQKYATTPHGGNADVGTNAVVQAVLLDNSTVNGNVIVGPGGPVTTALQMDPASHITGQATPEAELARMQQFKPPFDPDTAADPGTVGPGQTLALAPGPYTALVMPSGSTLQVSGGGIYYFRDSLQLSGARLVVSPASGPVQIYVGHELTIDANSKVNADDSGLDTITATESTGGLPGNLRIFICGTGTPGDRSKATIGGGSQAWMVLCGRKLDVGISAQSHLYGCVRADQITVTHAAIHYDSTLGGATLGGQVAWTPDATTEKPVSDPALLPVFPNINDPSAMPVTTEATPNPTPAATPPPDAAPASSPPISAATSTPHPSPTPHRVFGGGGGSHNAHVNLF